MRIKKIDDEYCVELFHKFRHMRINTDNGFSFKSIIEGKTYYFEITFSGDVIRICDEHNTEIDELIIPHNHGLKREIIYYKPLRNHHGTETTIWAIPHLRSNSKCISNRTTTNECAVR